MNEKKEDSSKKKYNKGLIALSSILLFFLIFWFFILDLIVEKYIEKAGTEAVGAKVELASVDVSLFPAGIDLFKLQVTNPQKPMENSVEIGQINAVMEVVPLLKRKIIVDNLLFDKVQLNTLREKSGAIKGQEVKKTGKEAQKPEWYKEFCQSNDINLFEMPDIDSILKDEYKSLKSVKLAEDIKNSISNEEANYKKKLDNLLDDKKIEEYRARIKKIRKKESSSLGILGSVLEYREIYKEIEDDLDDIKDVEKEFKATLNKFKKDLKKLSAARASDINRLKKKYSFLSGEKLEFAKLLFGESLCSQLDKYSQWIALVEPYFDLSDKQDKKNEPHRQEAGKPGEGVYLLIKNMQTNLLFKNGIVKGKATNITNMPVISKLPTTIDFSGGGFEGLGSMDLQGVLNFVNPDHPLHKIKFDISGLLLDDFVFSDKEDLSVAMLKSVTSLVSNMTLDGNKLTGSAKAQFDKVVMQAESIKGSSIQKALVKALSDIDKFNLVLSMMGVGEDFNIAIKSDLDKFFQNTMAKMAQSKMGDFDRGLKASILQKTAGPIKQSNESFAGFSKIDGQLSEKSAQSNALLSEID
jgi:uncharacterized protein (TIGR03545 family)